MLTVTYIFVFVIPCHTQGLPSFLVVCICLTVVTSIDGFSLYCDHLKYCCVWYSCFWVQNWMQAGGICHYAIIHMQAGIKHQFSYLKQISNSNPPAHIMYVKQNHACAIPVQKLIWVEQDYIKLVRFEAFPLFFGSLNSATFISSPD